MATKIGKAKYGGGKKTYFKLKEGDSVFRILPPLGDLADDGFWSMYYKVHYGYKNTEGKARPFVSPLVQDYKTKEISSPDAAMDRLNKLKETLDAAKKAGNKKNVEELHKLVGAPKSCYNLDNNHYLNAVDLQGNIGILKLRHKAKQALDVVIRKLRDKGIDPLSVEDGRFFVFTRTGMGNETQFAVSVYKQEMEVAGVGTVERDVVHVLTDEIINRLDTEAAQLNKLFRQPTSDEVAQIVAESKLATGISPNIDEILGYSSNDTAGDAEGEEESQASESSAQEPAQEAAAPKEEPKKEVKKAAPAPKAEAPKEEPKAEAKPEPKKETKKATAPATTAQSIADMSEADFLATLGLNQ